MHRTLTTALVWDVQLARKLPGEAQILCGPYQSTGEAVPDAMRDQIPPPHPAVIRGYPKLVVRKSTRGASHSNRTRLCLLQ